MVKAGLTASKLVRQICRFGTVSSIGVARLLVSSGGSWAEDLPEGPASGGTQPECGRHRERVISGSWR